MNAPKALQQEERDPVPGIRHIPKNKLHMTGMQIAACRPELRRQLTTVEVGQCTEAMRIDESGDILCKTCVSDSIT